MNAYRYFSLIFSYPTEENLREIRELSKTCDIAGFRSGEALCTVPLEEAQAEYTRLFVSAYPALLCPPYESYYREEIVYGNASVEAGEWYRKHGLDFTYEGEPPDLLSAELDFLALTNDRAFLEKLHEWIYKFTERVKSNSKIYGVCAEDLENFLKNAGQGVHV
jgi:nitrate reductase assembly molybdenum cofactor insertion protein NarJ